MDTQGSLINLGRSQATMLLVSSCAVVATAALLGLDWLRLPVAGVPVGIWLIAMVQVQAWLIRRAKAGAGRELLATPAPTEHLKPQRPGLFSRIGAMMWESTRVLAGSLKIPVRWFGSLEDRISARFDRLIRQSRPLRIGIDAGPEFRGAICSQQTGLEIEWVVLSPGADHQATLRRHRLDALIRAAGHTPARPVQIVTLEHAEREAAWFDWATPRPLTYAAVFPVCVDVAQITLDETDLEAPGQAALISALLRTSASLSRSPGRLRLSDRLLGRLPAAGGAHGVRTPTGLLDRAMLELTAVVIEHASTGTAAAKAASRAASAWLASTEAWLDIKLRRQGVEAALSCIGSESEALLRAGAVRLAMCDDDAAFEAFKDAERAIRAGSHQQIGEHLAFLQAELEVGLPNPLTLGRVSAGICLVCSSSPADRAAFIRGDIMDDVRHSAWLVGRDQDRAVIGEIFSLMGADRVQPGFWELRDAA